LEDSLRTSPKRRPAAQLLCLSALLVSTGLVPRAFAEPARAPDPAATQARTASVNESTSLHLASHHGSILNEQGPGTGTFNCPVQLTLNISYTTATISFTLCHSGGSISGHGNVTFYTTGTYAKFKGYLSSTSATGRYAHDSARNLQIQGTLQRNNYSLTARVTGTMNDD
jgi:hypothetical protein